MSAQQGTRAAWYGVRGRLVLRSAAQELAEAGGDVCACAGVGHGWRKIVPAAVRLTLLYKRCRCDMLQSRGVRDKQRVIDCAPSNSASFRWSARGHNERRPGYRYRRSVAEHVSDAEFLQLQSFRLAGKVLFLRCLKTKRQQPCATVKYSSCSGRLVKPDADLLLV